MTNQNKTTVIGKDRWSFEQRMLNHWFGRNIRSFMDYCRRYSTSEVMLANLNRDKPKFYERLKALAEAELIYLGRKVEEAEK